MREETSAGATGAAGRRVVVAGATSESGAAVSAALVGAGASVVALGSNPSKLAELAERVPGITTEVCDLTDSAAVDALAARLTAASDGGSVDGLVHLVGGWVGGRGIAGQSDEGWEAMERSFRTLRNTTRAFYLALLASPAGRAVFVSSESVDAPTASGASYTAAKAASESWMRSVAQGFAADQSAAGLHSAATILVVKALVDDRMRAASPEKTFPGFTDVTTLAAAVLDLWEKPASELNGARTHL
ncbi:SDR family oxidoreductase [Herbiconiux sp. KACC 21604]|uniref:SDR family oxidoreductase n=1 Tax=unclassified Herbiconiux TaxID=2618217 RepID=UPI001491B446|nr:SDR family oxidoreductase [Herbiconiux sp. SALV-R1]QJU55368.1 SDR family oxidoreductase [Herbiconiux sp. SALV-R1]WPO86539.1 SDR family oxidoreductase [Herbiconiux sp. KACC 21604]